MLDSQPPISEIYNPIKEMKKPESGGALDTLVPPSPIEGHDPVAMSPTHGCPQQDPPKLLPSSAPIAAKIVTQETSNGASEKLTQVHMMTQLADLQRQVTEGEAERGRQMQYIMAMHAWAAKTAVSMRKMQEQCDMVRHSLVQVQAQQEATACTLQQLETVAGGKAVQARPQRRGKRQRTGRLQRVPTNDSLNLALSSSARDASEDNNNNNDNEVDKSKSPFMA